MSGVSNLSAADRAVRDKAIAQAAARGAKLSALAKEWEITYERVRQIIKRQARITAALAANNTERAANV